MTHQQKKSDARRAYWAKQTQEQRTAQSKHMLEVRYAGTTPEQRSEMMKAMIKARWDKRKELSTDDNLQEK